MKFRLVPADRKGAESVFFRPHAHYGSRVSDRWIIIKNGQSVGPLTAEEIRASLRDGSFDPFDLVMREGSSVRRELVEVDELFQSSPVVYDASSSGQASMTGPKGANADGKITELVA